MPRIPPTSPVRAPSDPTCTPGRTCDGLECLCRPRFFAGQLLTDEDLRRLDHYIVAKGRLHNRYLHGTGVVCGLEVVCNPCDDTVTVRTGYAIGPCGEDIVVCHDTSVDVGDLIRAHRRRRAKDCEPFGGRPAQDCEAARQRWILAICYEERPSRGVTSLRQPDPAGCEPCAGNGNGNGHGHDGACDTPTRARPAPAQCEPTVTCEGYRFVLLKEPPRRTGRQDGLAGGLADSELGRRVRLCLLDLAGRMRDLGQAGGSTADLVALCCDLEEDLRDIIETGNVHDCMIGARLAGVVCPDVTDDDAKEKATASIQQLLAIAIDLFKSCVCSALLPPCGVGSPDDCIPLAALTVRTADLRVLEICNWSSRRFAMTFPTLGYWLGWLPVFDTLRAAISRLCCAPTRPRFKVDDRMRVKVAAADVHENRTIAGARPAQPAGPAGPADGVRMNPKTVGDLATYLARNATSLSGLEATVLAALGARDEHDAALASEAELADPLAALALSRLAGPALGDVLPEPVADALARLVGASPGGNGRADVDAERVTRLEASLEDLQKKVSSQARTIANLRKRIGGDK